MKRKTKVKPKAKPKAKGKVETVKYTHTFPFSATGLTTTDLILSGDKKIKKDKQKYLVIDRDDNLEYVIKVKTNKDDNRVFKLFYSNADIWCDHVKGSLRLTMTDVGDGMTFEFADGVNLSKLDYAELEILRLVTRLEFKLYNGRYHKVIKVSK